MQVCSTKKQIRKTTASQFQNALKLQPTLPFLSAQTLSKQRKHSQITPVCTPTPVDPLVTPKMRRHAQQPAWLTFRRRVPSTLKRDLLCRYGSHAARNPFVSSSHLRPSHPVSRRLSSLPLRRKMPVPRSRSVRCNIMCAKPHAPETPQQQQRKAYSPIRK